MEQQKAIIWYVFDGDPEAKDGLVRIPQRPGFGWQTTGRGLTPISDSEWLSLEFLHTVHKSEAVLRHVAGDNVDTPE